MIIATTRTTHVSERVPWASCERRRAKTIVHSIRTHPRIFHAVLPSHDDQERILSASRWRSHHQAPMTNAPFAPRQRIPCGSARGGGRGEETNNRDPASESSHSAASAVGTLEGDEEASGGAAVTACYRGHPPFLPLSLFSIRVGTNQDRAASAEVVRTHVRRIISSGHPSSYARVAVHETPGYPDELAHNEQKSVVLGQIGSVRAGAVAGVDPRDWSRRTNLAALCVGRPLHPWTSCYLDLVAKVARGRPRGGSARLPFVSRCRRVRRAAGPSVPDAAPAAGRAARKGGPTTMPTPRS
jgi:hypothetical protein